MKPARQRLPARRAQSPDLERPRVVFDYAHQDDLAAAREAEESIIDVLADILDAAERRRVG